MSRHRQSRFDSCHQNWSRLPLDPEELKRNQTEKEHRFTLAKTSICVGVVHKCWYVSLSKRPLDSAKPVSPKVCSTNH